VTPAANASGKGKRSRESERSGGRFGNRGAGGQRLGDQSLRAEVVADEPAIEVVDEQVAVGVARRAAETAVAALPDEEIGAVDDGVAVEVRGQAEEFRGDLPADVGERGVVERGEKLALAEGERWAERRFGLRAWEKRRAGDVGSPVLTSAERDCAAIERDCIGTGKCVA
jgi:hypothetical protein